MNKYEITWDDGYQLIKLYDLLRDTGMIDDLPKEIETFRQTIGLIIMFTKEELFYIVDCLDQDYYNIKDIKDLELQRAELSKNARICSILHDLICC